MPDNVFEDIQPRPVGKTACYNCGKVVDVSAFKAFDVVPCPGCKAKISVPGRMGSDFVLLKLLGRGEMGATYKAFEKSLGRHVAIKVMRKNLGEDERRKQDFFTEAKALAVLDHPNTVRVYSLGEEDGQPYMVMELINGPRLDQLFTAEKPMDETRAMEIALSLSKALSAAGEIGLIHGDIKPANVMIDDKGRTKLLDFGIARFGGGKVGKDDALGTPYYVPPEQIRREHVDFRADIYSLGATIFHALTGSPPFPGKSVREVLDARLNRPAPDIRDLRPMLRSQTANAVNKMLATDPSGRQSSYKELVSELEAALTAATGKSSPGAAAPAAPEARKKSFSWAALFVLLALVGGGGAAWYQFLGPGANRDANTGGSSIIVARTQPATTPAGQVAAPEFRPGGKNITVPLDVTIACDTPEAQIRYTTDGTEPTVRSQPYTKEIAVQPGTTVRARAFREGWNASAIVEVSYPKDSGPPADLMTMRVLAQKAVEKLRNVDRGQGLGEKIEHVEVLLANAEEFYRRGEYGKAIKPYADLPDLCGEVEVLARKRQAADEARQAAKSIINALLLTVTGMDRNNDLPKAQKSLKAADEEYEKGKFEDAAKDANQAEETAKALEQRVLKQVRSAWEGALKEGELPLLQAHGAQWWQTIQQNLSKAEQSEKMRMYAQAGKQYAEALKYLPFARQLVASAATAAEYVKQLDSVRKLVEAGESRKAEAGMRQLLKAYSQKQKEKEVWELLKTIQSELRPAMNIGEGAVITFVLVDANTFTMGSPIGEKGHDAKEIEHEVTLTRAYYMATTEVTRRAWNSFIKNGKQNVPRSLQAPNAPWRSPGWKIQEYEPIVNVSWKDANAFCQWVSQNPQCRGRVRLPTEAEWEMACRAGSKTAYCYGDDAASLKNYGHSMEGGLKQPSLVARAAANIWGLYDMHGNVWEWCQDFLADYTTEAATDPKGPTKGLKRVVRGGSYRDPAARCRSAFRFGLPDEPHPFIGFRVVMECDAKAPAAAPKKEEEKKREGDR